jgi:hypothetical protein
MLAGSCLTQQQSRSWWPPQAHRAQPRSQTPEEASTWRLVHPRLQRLLRHRGWYGRILFREIWPSLAIASCGSPFFDALSSQTSCRSTVAARRTRRAFHQRWSWRCSRTSARGSSRDMASTAAATRTEFATAARGATHVLDGVPPSCPARERRVAVRAQRDVVSEAQHAAVVATCGSKQDRTRSRVEAYGQVP